MRAEKSLSFSGDNKEEAVKAWDRIKSFVTKHPKKEDYFRYMYVNVTDKDRKDYEVSEGGSFKTEFDINHVYDAGLNIIKDCENLIEFFIRGSIERDE